VDTLVLGLPCGAVDLRESNSPAAEGGRMAEEERRRFANLRSVRWRVDLGILPASPEASVDELRRAAADSRRR